MVKPRRYNQILIATEDCLAVYALQSQLSQCGYDCDSVKDAEALVALVHERLEQTHTTYQLIISNLLRFKIMGNAAGQLIRR